MPKFNKNRRFNMEQLETRRLMARNTGVDDDPGFEEPTAPSVHEGEAVAVSRWRPESRIPYLVFPIDTPPADGTPNAAGTGNVKTQFYNGTLTLSEDPNQLGSDQRIIISLVNGKLRVASANGQTLIDGQPFKDFDSVTHLSINFAGGSDSVTINGVSLQSLNSDLRDPDTGANGDVVHLDGVAVAGGVTIRTGVGHDEVVIANSNITGDGAAGEVGIYTSETTAQGDADGDSVSLVGVRTASSLKVSTGAGDDKVLIFQSQIGDGFGGDRVTIKTGAGADASDIGY